MAIVFFVLKYTIGLRAHKEEEIAGLDRSDFNLVETSYQEFMQIQIDPLEEKLLLLQHSIVLQLRKTKNNFLSWSLQPVVR